MYSLSQRSQRQDWRHWATSWGLRWFWINSQPSIWWSVICQERQVTEWRSTSSQWWWWCWQRVRVYRQGASCLWKPWNALLIYTIYYRLLLILCICTVWYNNAVFWCSKDRLAINYITQWKLWTVCRMHVLQCSELFNCKSNSSPRGICMNYANTKLDKKWQH